MKRAYLAAAIAASVLAAVSAQAGCFRPLGCTDTDYFRRTDLAQQRCEILWKMRNTILKERGLCFEKEREIATFGNAGCRYQFANTLLFNSAERDNLTNITSVEKAKHCPR
ncbi:MAG TPA: YARHG domain-containing protein [Xanthobacteraceae bacterium]|nr:YARHG domain-containing protein [Xanthobacteraceae bacterium]